ncbi:MAG: hypothetical protein R3E08_06540 [Thiotrichaceae bacterium]
MKAGGYNGYVLTFLDHLVELARQNDVYLVLRLYDTYYYKDNFYATVMPMAITQAENGRIRFGQNGVKLRRTISLTKIYMGNMCNECKHYSVG